MVNFQAKVLHYILLNKFFSPNFSVLVLNDGREINWVKVTNFRSVPSNVVDCLRKIMVSLLLMAEGGDDIGEQEDAVGLLGIDDQVGEIAALGVEVGVFEERLEDWLQLLTVRDAASG